MIFVELVKCVLIIYTVFCAYLSRQIQIELEPRRVYLSLRIGPLIIAIVAANGIPFYTH